MKDRAKDWLFIEEEIVSSISMSNAGAKESAILAYEQYKKGRTSFAELKYGIMRLIKRGYSAFKTIDDLRDCFEMKEYYTANRDEYGEYFEDELKLSFMAD